MSDDYVYEEAMERSEIERDALMDKVYVMISETIHELSYAYTYNSVIELPKIIRKLQDFRDNNT